MRLLSVDRTASQTSPRWCLDFSMSFHPCGPGNVSSSSNGLASTDERGGQCSEVTNFGLRARHRGRSQGPELHRGRGNVACGGPALVREKPVNIVDDLAPWTGSTACATALRRQRILLGCARFASDPRRGSSAPLRVISCARMKRPAKRGQRMKKAYIVKCAWDADARVWYVRDGCSGPCDGGRHSRGHDTETQIADSGAARA